jgi:hypothetical protein
MRPGQPHPKEPDDLARSARIAAVPKGWSFRTPTMPMPFSHAISIDFYRDTREAKAVAVVYPRFCGDCRTIEARVVGGSIELRARAGPKSVMSGSASSHV